MVLQNVLKKLNVFVLIMVTMLLFTLNSTAFAVTFYGEDFNSMWSTINPPVTPSGDTWRISISPGDTSTNDWHRKDALLDPWSLNLTPYACLLGDQLRRDSLYPDSLYSPVINCSSFYNITLRCSTYFYPLDSGGSYQAALYGSIDSGATWPYLIRNFTGLNIPAQLLTDNLPWAANQNRVRFLWVYEGDPAALSFWCIDDVSLTGSTINDTDIATIRITRPGRFELPTPISIPFISTFRNVGRLTIPNIYVNCEIRNLADTNTIVTQGNGIIDSIIAGDSIVYNFLVGANLDTGLYIATVWCEALGDQDGTNDTLRKVFRVGWLEEQKYDDSISVRDSSFVHERYGWGVKFYNNLYPNQPAFLHSVKFHFSLPLDTLSNQFRIRICDDDVGGGPGTPLYESGILTAVTDWNNIDLSLDSIAIWDSSFYVFFIQVEGSPLSPKLSFDARRDTEAMYWACYDSVYVQDFTTGDWMIRCVLDYQIEYPRPNGDDFRTVFIGSPEENIVVRPPNRTFIPKARIENWGWQSWINIPVVCSIMPVNATGDTYTDILTVDLNPEGDTLLSFHPWSPNFRGPARITVRTQLPSDVDPMNDAKEETLFVHRSVFVGQDFSINDYRWIDSDTTGGPTYAWVDTTQPWTYYPYTQGDDATHFIPMVDSSGRGFTFRYYDNLYRAIWVSDNGWIRIGPDTGYAPPGNPDNTALPDSLLPNNTIYAFWDDLAYGSFYGGGGIFFKRYGVSPNQKFAVIYQDVRRKNAPNSDPISFEVILHENGIITVQYKDVFCSDARYNYGRSATVGVEDSLGTYGMQYLYGEAGAGGRYPGNKLQAGLAIKMYPYKKDVSLFRKIAPNIYSLPGVVTPRFRLINFGTTTINEPFPTYLRIGLSYYDSVQTNTTLEPNDSVTLTFPPINLNLGTYALKCSTALPLDQINSNDFIAESIYVQSWARKPDIPRGYSRRKVKSGALAYHRAAEKIYALKGSNELEFQRYDIMTETWESLPPLPDSNSQTGKRKKAKAGTSLCYADGYIYAIKGGNTQDFYAYNILQDTWIELCTIPKHYTTPLGWSTVLKKPKYGAALVYAPITGRIYLLSGNRSLQFLSYDPGTNLWEVKDSIPAGYPRRKVKAGGALTVGGDTIYAIKGSRANDFYAYILSQDTWRWLKPIPVGLANKRVKAGAGLAYYQGRVYCLKGGNTIEWWIYYQQQDTWMQGPSIPLGIRNKKVKRGGALVGTDSLIFAFKGGNTQEFWAYGPAFDSFVAVASSNGPSEEMAQNKIVFGLWTFPNPAINQIKIHYGVTQKTKIRIDVYNVLGERVKTLVNEEKPIGTYSLFWDGKADNGKRVSAGIYVAKIKQADKTKTNKLIIAK